jgi:adenylate cyclase
MSLATYLPQDRLRALARGESLPSLANGSVLFADISGFTHLTETLRELLGPRRGAEELTKYLDAVYTGLINEVEQDGGSVIGFAGDSITCWFDDAHGLASPRAAHCAFALQRSMSSVTVITLPNNTTINLALKVTVATGPIRRFTLGDPSVKYLDALVGTTVMRTSAAEHLAGKGDVLVDEATVNVLGDSLIVKEWRHGDQERFAVAADFIGEASAPALPLIHSQPNATQLQPWINPIIFEREQAGQEFFLTEFRPCIAMFVRFIGIDYDSNEAGEQLDTLVRQMQACAERHQGALLQVTIGDKGSYAYISFGALSKHEDDARRAVKTALDLKEAVAGLGFLAPLQIGISQGVMRVGACGGRTRREYSALGDDVNIAARLMTSAAPGEILISDRLRKGIPDNFMMEARPSMKMKGKAELLPVFAVLGMEQQRAIRLQEPSYALAMIGRGREMALLGEKLQSILQGRGQIIGVTAEAGMGKSRLVSEGIRLARRNRLVGYGGTCQSDGTNTPYLVWHPIWNAFFDLDPFSPLRRQIRLLEGELEDRALEHVDALPLLGSALGLSLPENDFTLALQPKDRKTQLETMLVKCIESAAHEAAEDRGGLLLVLEDLHWIDQVSFDLLEVVARAIENLPVFILLTYRGLDANLQGRTLTRLESLGHFTQIKLEELNAPETEQVIRSKLFNLFPERGGTVPPVLIERITSRAQGNPFYVEELLNYLHDRGTDLGDAKAIQQMDLPTSLHSLILSRIDQLTPSQQLTLKVASIIGRVFRFEDLHNYYPSLGIAEKLRADLRELERLEFTPLESPEPDLAHLFKHPVTHEVSYESLSFAARVQLHGQYAIYLESAYPDRVDQLAAQMAHHFEQAQIRDKACFYLLKAGEQASASFASDEALAYFDRVLSLVGTETPRMRFDALFKRERVYDLLARRTEQRQDLQELGRLCDQFKDAPSLQAQIARRQVKLEIDTGNYTAAKARAEAALQEIDVNAFPELFIDALLLEARALFLVGQAVDARPVAENALDLARTHQYVRGQYNALAQLGLCIWYSGDTAGAAALLEQSLEQIRQAGDIRRELEILNNLGIVIKDMYRFSEALVFYEQARQIAKKIGDRTGEASLLTNMGRACLVSGDYVRADRYCAEAATLAVEVREPITQAMALHNRSESYRQLGQYKEAKKTGEQSLELVRSGGYRVGEADALENIALIEFSLGKHMEALEHAHSALEIAREVSARRVEASVLTRIGYMRLKLAQLDEAEKAFLDAREIEQELDDSIPMFELQAGLAGVALERGESDSLENARSQVQELTAEILRDPPTGQSQILPMGLYLMCIRVAHACSDPCTAQLINRAAEELQARFAKISDASLRTAYMNIPEHRDILEYADGNLQKPKE